MENNNAVSVDADINEMRAHLRKAVKTLKTQPYRNGDKPRGVISSWVLVDASDRGLGDNIPRHKQIKSRQSKSVICITGLTRCSRLMKNRDVL